jgi:polyferredoxin
LAKLLGKSLSWIRLRVQIIWALLSNAYIVGFLNGKIYQGNLKSVCVPGLNCYACPGALGSCPIGSLQAVFNSSSHTVSTYVAGTVISFGAIFGRFNCGWLCPFGLLQDLLYAIPLPKKVKKIRVVSGERILRTLRYVILVLLVIILPMMITDTFGQGSPWFCKWVCPSGTLSGLLLLLGNPTLRGALGWLFAWKNVILITIVLLSLLIWRPFCRYICPLGAIYGLFNPVALYRFKIDTGACTKCTICQKTCKMDIPVYNTPNSPDCVRCGACIQACPHHAILHGKEVFTNRDVVENA